MKKLAVLMVFILATFCQAQIETIPFPKNVSTKTVGDYKKELASYEDSYKNVHNEDFYKDLVFKNKKTSETKRLKDFEEFHRKLFLLFATEQFTHELTETYEKWEEESKNLEEGTAKQKDDEVANKENVKKFTEQLMTIRKKTAEKYESYIEKIYKDYADKFNDEEKITYRKATHDYHDKYKLIERKKKS